MIYLDSAFCIYAVEDTHERGEHALALFGQPERFAVSPLVLLECFVKPFRDADVQLEDDYRHFFDQLTMLAMDMTTYERAARLRASTQIRTPDALHWAVAGQHDCAAIWTGDQRFAHATNGYAVDVFADEA